MAGIPKSLIIGVTVIVCVALLVFVVRSAMKWKKEKEEMKEGYVNVPQGVALIDGNACNDSEYRYSDSQILSRPNYKPQYPPNFFNGSSTAQLRGAQAPRYVRGDRQDPMSLIELVGESYDAPAELDIVNANELRNFDDPLKYQDVALPETNMEMMNFGKDPRDPQTFVYDRLIYANQKRRGRAEADLIRGDIPIAGIDSHKGWFNVSVVPHLDTVVGSIGMGMIGSAYDQIGAQYETNVSPTGDVQTTRNPSVTILPYEVTSFS